MNIMKKLLFLILCSVFSATLSATSISGKVKLLSHEVSGSYVQLVGQNDAVLTDNPGNCSQADLLHLPIAHANYTVLSSSLLIAQTSQQTVTLELDGCEQNRNKIAFLRFGDWSGIATGTPTQAPQVAEQSITHKNLVPETAVLKGRFPNGLLSGSVGSSNSVWTKVLNVEGRGYINYLEFNAGQPQVNLIIDGKPVFEQVYHVKSGRFAIIDENSTDHQILDRIYFNKKLELEMIAPANGPYYHVNYNIVKLAD